MHGGVMSRPRKNPSTHLPPPDVVLYDAAILGKLETPVDEHGLVKLDALVTLVKQTVDPSYVWEVPFNSVHHLHYPARWYTEGGTDTEIAIKTRFREQTARKMLGSHAFHSWAHETTIPPSLPHLDVMHICVMAEDAVMPLNNTALLATKIARNPYIPEKARQVRLNEEYDNYMRHLENARAIPKEFRPLDLDALEASSVEEMLDVSKYLGKRALHMVPYRHRAIMPAAA